MATTTMRLGLLLILAVAIIQISKGEKEDESQMEQKSEGNMMASSMEEVELRTVREAGKNKQKKCGIKCRRKGGSNKKRRCNKKKCKRERKNNKKGKKKGSKKRTRKTKPTKKGKKGKKQGKKGKEGKEDLKKKKRTKKFKKNPNISVRQTCDEAALCQKIKDYIKYSNQLRKVKRIVKSCDTMEKKANKSATEFDATVAALDEVIASNAKRRLYIRWRRTQRSTDEVVAIRDNLKNCSVSAKAKCEKKVEPACLETALHTECEASLQAWLNSFGPSKGSCLQASADCCACITALPTVDAKCLDFDTKSTNAVASKKKCTGGTETGSFGFCRKQQQEASVKGPPAACGGSTATKAPPSATTAAGATTAAPAGTTNAAAATTAAATSSSCTVKCGVKKQGTKIVGGTEATVNEYPWLAHLDMGCGGSIVADKWIVTAAHCFFDGSGNPTVTNANIAQTNIKIGEHDFSVTSETSLTKTMSGDLMILHPQYVWATNLNDIALVRVPAIDLKVYTPVCLPTQGANYDGKKAWVYGWGALQSGGASPDKLQELELTIVTDASAKQSYSTSTSPLSADQLAVMVFAGGEEGKDACQGDSGGPFTYGNPDNNGAHELVGAVSWGLGCAAAGLPGAYAEVSAYRTWIDDEIKKNGGGVFTC